MVRGSGRITESWLVLRVFLRTSIWRLLGMSRLGVKLFRTGRMPLKREKIQRQRGDGNAAGFGSGHAEGTGAMKYAYYPGCSLRGTGRAYEESLLAVFRALDVEIEEIEDWNCCGATTYMSVDELTSYALASRNLALAEREPQRDHCAVRRLLSGPQ